MQSSLLIFRSPWGGLFGGRAAKLKFPFDALCISAFHIINPQSGTVVLRCQTVMEIMLKINGAFR